MRRQKPSLRRDGGGGDAGLDLLRNGHIVRLGGQRLGTMELRRMAGDVEAIVNQLCPERIDMSKVR